MDRQHVVIVGLPGSGKSTLGVSLTSHVYFDDFINTLCTGKLASALKGTRPVCVSDPRLCNYWWFQKYIQPYFHPDTTQVILFENDPEQCIRNTAGRPGGNWPSTIRRLSDLYQPSKYQSYTVKHVPVYRPDTS